MQGCRELLEIKIMENELRVNQISNYNWMPMVEQIAPKLKFHIKLTRRNLKNQPFLAKISQNSHFWVKFVLYGF